MIAQGLFPSDEVRPRVVVVHIGMTINGEHVSSAPLNGVRVLDVSTVLAAPLSCALLGELGADVVKVEHPAGGDPTRSYPPLHDGVSVAWEQFGRGKRSVALDLHEPEGVALLHELIRTCEVVVTNFRAPTANRFGLDFETVSALRPGIVMFHLTAFGRTGPYADRPGFARVVEAFAGLTHRTGDAEGPPRFSGYPIADGVGGIYGAFSILAAMRQRDLTGEAQLVDLGLYEPMLRMMEDFIGTYGATGVSAGRIGNGNPAVVPNGLFPTADRRWVVLPASTDGMWRRLLRVLDRPDLESFDTMAARVDHRDLIDDAVARFTASYPLDDLLAVLHEAGIAAAPVNTAEDIVADPHVQARGSILRVQARDGSDAMIVGPAGRYSGFDFAQRGPAPALGEHTDEVLAQLKGVTTADIHGLRARGVIR